MKITTGGSKLFELLTPKAFFGRILWKKNFGFFLHFQKNTSMSNEGNGVEKMRMS